MIDKPIFILGGGIAGLRVAKTLADNGVKSSVVERDGNLGGNVRNWACMATDQCLRCFCCSVEDLVDGVISSDKIDVLTGWELSAVLESDTGEKRVRLKRIGTTEEKIADAEALVIATGFRPYDPGEKVLWGHGRVAGVYSLAEVNALLRGDMVSEFTGGAAGLRVAFFQCAGSRDATTQFNYCSQFCCKAALRMSLKLVHEWPDMAVTIFYIDLQMAGTYAGDLLKMAQDKNIRLCQGVPGEIRDSEDGLEVVVEAEGQNRKECFHRVILSVGERPNRVQPSMEHLGLLSNEFGFVQTGEALDGSRTQVEGIYVAGTCQGPKDIEATLEHADQTAAILLADLHKRGLLKS